jgi:hypothetical protein
VRQPDDAKRPDLLQHGRNVLARKVAARMIGVRFDLMASSDADHHFVIGYRPTRLVDALWQRFAEELAGMITSAKCPAPKCGRWFLRSAGRGDRQFCSHRCQMRAWRGSPLTKRRAVIRLGDIPSGAVSIGFVPHVTPAIGRSLQMKLSNSRMGLDEFASDVLLTAATCQSW